MIDKKFILKRAVDNMTEDQLLESWLYHLAEDKVWYDEHNNKHNLEDLSSTELFNIKNSVLQIYIKKKEIPFGAAKFIGLINFILAKKEVNVKLPF